MRITLLTILVVLLIILTEIWEIGNDPLSRLEELLFTTLVLLPAELALLADYTAKKKEKKGG